MSPDISSSTVRFDSRFMWIRDQLRAPSGSFRNAVVLVSLVLIGTGVRLVLGLRGELWASAPDQLAWGVLLAEAAEGPLRWDQLIYYPHEGGTLLMSMAAIFLGKNLLGMPALSWVALVADTIVRAGMIALAWRSLGSRTATLFAIWSVFAVPSLLPWATVNFGLHAFAAIWPFAALWVISRGGPPDKEAVGLGLVTGVGISFSYDALMLPVAACVVLLTSHRGWKGLRACAVYLLVTAVVVAPHLAARAWLDTGFALQGRETLSVRGLDLAPPAFKEITANICTTLTQTLPGASLLPGLGWFSEAFIRFSWAIALALGLAMVVRTRRHPRLLLFSFLVICTWLVLFSASPFFWDRWTVQSYVACRHVCAVLPLLVLLALHGAAHGPKPARVLAGFLVAASVWGGVLALVEATAPESSNWTAAGWALGSKLGHDPARLEALLGKVSEEDRSRLAFGYGWGIAATVLAPVNPPAPAAVEGVADLVNAFSPQVRPHVVEGVKHAFSRGVTPVIEPVFLTEVLKQLQAE